VGGQAVRASAPTTCTESCWRRMTPNYYRPTPNGSTRVLRPFGKFEEMLRPESREPPRRLSIAPPRPDGNEKPPSRERRPISLRTSRCPQRTFTVYSGSERPDGRRAIMDPLKAIAHCQCELMTLRRARASAPQPCRAGRRSAVALAGLVL